MIIYKLEHKRVVDHYDDELVYSTITIGYYSSYGRIKQTISKYRNIDGFKDYPNNFMICKYRVNYLLDQKIYELTHSYEDQSGYDNITWIGIYSNIRDAYYEIDKLKALIPFSDNLDGFNIDEYTINEDHWCEGFFTY